MNLPFKIMYYEDFLTDYVNQTKSLLQFYELANVVKIEDHQAKPIYTANSNFFNMKDKIKIKAFIKTLASERTYALFDRYLKDIPDVAEE